MEVIEDKSLSMSINLRNALAVKLKTQPLDFQVNEVPLPSLFKEGDIYIYRLQKTGLTTKEAANLMSAHFSCPLDRVGYSGLKDEDGVTSQLVSMPKIVSSVEIKGFHDRYPNLQLLYQGTTDKDLQIGILLGNAFKVTARNISKDLADKLKEISNYRSFYINYYGTQRFGKSTQTKNTHILGQYLTQQQYKEAFSLISEQLESDNLYGNDPKEYFRRIDPRKFAFYLNSYYSYNWNQSLLRRIERFASHYELFYEEKISYSYIRDKVDKLALISELNEQEIIKYRVNQDKKCYSLVSQRPTLIPVDIYITNLQEDTIHREKKSVDLSFFLPSGSYATVVVPQFFYEIGSFG